MSPIVQPPHWLRPRRVRAAIVAGAALACAVGTVAAVAAGPVASSASARAGVTRASTPVSKPRPINHQLCYAAQGKYKIPPKIKLFNQFSPKGFVPKLGAVTTLCNPVVKTLPDGQSFPVTNPAAHLVCFSLTAAKQPTPEVLVTNQFGSSALVTGQPNSLCLPSWKSLTGPPKKKAPQPPGLSHFTCYPVKLAPGATGFTNVPSFVMLTDEFSAKPVTAKVSRVPTGLCLPTEKVIGKTVSKITNAQAHLLCFPVSPTDNKRRVWAQNQFGTSILTVGNSQTLCLPSAKQVLPPVDHQLCYTAKATGKFKIPAKIELINQFSIKGFEPKFGPAVLHCNPVVKTLAGGVQFPVTNPDAHLLCFSIKAPLQPAPEVRVTNQFGTALLQPGQPNLLCLPSWKSLKGPPKEKVSQPPGLSHFTCYPVKVVPGTPGYQVPPRILLQDEFTPKPVPVKVSAVPQELCLPTEKIVRSGTFKIINPLMHLLCFTVSATPIRPTVWDENQFGTSAIKIASSHWLCLPSTKQIVPPTP